MRAFRLLPLLALTGLVLLAAPAAAASRPPRRPPRTAGRPRSSTSTSPRGG